MNLLIMRHAEAAPIGGEIMRDADRVLTARGENDAVLVGRSLKTLSLSPDLILTSPLERAKKTGAILSSVWKHRPEVRPTEHLGMGFRQKSLLADLKALQTLQTIIIVGHQPDMSDFIAYCIADSKRAALAMPVASAARLTLTFNSSHLDATLHWLLTPDLIRTLAAPV